jgi:hypothetical protein
MKKLFIMVALGTLLAQPIVAQKRTTTDREFWLLKGPVKTVQVERAEIKLKGGQATEGQRRLLSLTTYGEKGDKLEEISYRYDGSVQEKRVFTHDGVRPQTEVAYNVAGTVISKSFYGYDSEGRASGSSVYGPDGALLRKSVRTYASDGNLAVAASYNPDGSLINKTVFKYDSEGKQAEDIVYNSTGQVIQRSARNGDQFNVVLYNGDGTIFLQSARQTPTQEYDSHGNWIKQRASVTNTQSGLTEESGEVIYRTITYY